jgi:glycosyltransferase involved in cell wall biosynthesis
MRNHGWEARVVCIEHIDRGPADGLWWEDDVYQEVPVRRLSYDLSQAADSFRWEYHNPWIEAHLRQFLEEFQPQLFHQISGYVIGASALRAAQALGIPTVVTMTDFWFFCRRLTLVQPTGRVSDHTRFDAQACARCLLEEKRRFRLPTEVFPPLADLGWGLIYRTGVEEKLGLRRIVEQFEQRNLLLMNTLEQTRVIICPTPFLIETLLAHGFEKSKLSLNSHGLDRSSWLPAEPGSQSDGVFRIGYMGQIIEQKGVHLLLEALPKLKTTRPVEVLIYGDEQVFPGYASRLRKLADGDGRFKMMGKYDYPSVGRLLSSLDVLVIPSTWNEIGPWVMYEAFSMQTPVIASNIPNMSYVVRHEQNGLLFERANSSDLARQIQRFLDEPGLRQRLAAGAPPVRTIDMEMADLQQVYSSLV